MGARPKVQLQCSIKSLTLEEVVIYVRDSHNRQVGNRCSLEIKGPSGGVEVSTEVASDGALCGKYPALTNIAPGGSFVMKVMFDSHVIAKYIINTTKTPGSNIIVKEKKEE